MLVKQCGVLVRLRLLRGLLCAAVVSAAGFPTVAVGAGWTLQSDLGGSSPSVGAPSVAIDPVGNVSLLWSRSNGVANDVQALSHPAGSGGWVGQTTLSGSNTFNPQIAVGADGTTFAIWRWFDGTKYRVQVASKPPGEGWTGAQTISTAGGNAYTPSIAVSRSGSVAAIWARHNGTNLLSETGYLPRGRTWTIGGVGSGQLVGGETQVGVDAAGNAVFLWGGPQGSVDTAYRRDDGFDLGGDELTPSGGGGSLEPQLAVGDDGTAVAVWVQQDIGLASVFAATRSGSGGWQFSPEPLSAGGPFAASPRVAVDSRGNAVAAWIEDLSSSGLHVLRAATRPVGGSWSESVLVSDVDEGPTAPSLAVDPNGNAYLVWVNASGIVREASLRTIRGGAVWSAPVDLSPAGQVAAEPAVATSASGEAVATWVASRAASATIDASALDISGPSVDAAVPATGTAGVPVPFQGTATDDWSAIQSAAWDFGDGATANAINAQHTYAGAGTFVPTLRVVDSAGNATIISRRVTIEEQILVHLTRAITHPTWSQSRLKGVLRVSGSAAVAGRATITLQRVAAKRAAKSWWRKLTPGAFNLSLPLPPGLPPGRYVATIRLAGQPSSQFVTIPAPTEGVVSRAYIGGRLNGPPAIELLHPSSMHAVFRFTTLPKSNERITVTWSTTGVTKTFPKPRSRTIGAYIIGIKPGTWRCILRAGGKVVRVVSVVVR